MIVRDTTNTRPPELLAEWLDALGEAGKKEGRVRIATVELLRALTKLHRS